RCAMVGCVGTDGFGERLQKTLASAAVNTDHVRPVDGCSSGVALIGVEAGGGKAITIIPRANAHACAGAVARAEPLLRDADVLLLQLEIPLETVQPAIIAARRHGVLTILNPAPAPGPLPPALLAVDVLCPNVSEAALLTGLPIADTD